MPTGMPLVPLKTFVNIGSPRVRAFFIGAFLTAAAIHGAIISFYRTFHFRDFDVHREVGRRFLSGEYLYGGGLCYPYMPAAAMYFAPLALVERNVGLAVRYAVAIACLVVTLALLHRMVQGHVEALRPVNLTVGAVAVFLALQFVLQDLDDGGPHLILLALLMAGIYAASRERDVAAGVWFGLSIALKITPALFIPFFLWKRRWRLAAYTMLAAVVWIVLPTAWMGPSNWWSHQKEWAVNAGLSLSDRPTGFAEGNEQRVRNQSLRQTLMRYLVTYPEDHPLRRDDPGFAPVLNLPPARAQLIVLAFTAALIGVFAWASRKPWQGTADPLWLRQCAAMLILLLLLSPITWQQHLVWLIPALYVIIGDIVAEGAIGFGRGIVVGGYVLLTMVLNYEVLGKERFAVVLSYHPFAIAMLLVFGLLMVGAREKTAGRWTTRFVYGSAQEEGSRS